MVADPALRMEAVKDPRLGGMTSLVSLKFCWKFTENALDYKDYIDQCNINGDCYRVFSNYYSPGMQYANKWASSWLCSFKDIEDRIDELHQLAKKYKDPETAEDIQVRLKNLNTFRQQYMQVFAEDLKDQFSLKDQKYLAGKEYKHVAVSGVKNEAETVTA
ncbi:hypothetical protein BEWA_034960 [Theileria equi strain WA]|uniref:Uncharacterized protein n=1 Tax=Theileria equi strain WA TaxID=1537102 RepID=L1LDY5_THEEQ|nr:hypothetical protein BEWA_034960 [Theileria equi strain WA]EKX73460.1 hypothetical protein BEWA_034960 [Theileria equi strain WA]|eukprot:XP_004832912.1 hypothetical protein BEWA_034960 [Theileria equi strain WA]